MDALPDRQDDKRSWPVFLIGCHRSGTTLLRYILDSHENIVCPPESKFVAALQNFLEYPQVMGALVSLGFSVEEIYDQLTKVIDAFLGGCARKAGKARWVDKTPNYYRVVDFIDEIYLGKVLYLFLARHPFDCAVSLRRMFYFASRHHEDREIARAVETYGKGLDGWARFWNEVNERLLAFSGLHPRRCHWIRYEDLVTAPQPVVQAALEFLGESLPENLVETAFQKTHGDGYQDPKIRRTRGIRRNRIGQWREWPASQVAVLWQIVGPTALRLGYTEPGRASFGPLKSPASLSRRPRAAPGPGGATRSPGNG